MNSVIEIPKPPLFYANYESEERIKVNQGGTSSGKTYTIIDLLFLLGIQNKGWVITVVSETIPNLKKGAYRDAKTIHSKSELYKSYYTKINETERTFYCRTGSILEFNTITDEQDAKSGKRNVLFVNEANGIPYNIYWQLQIRTKNLVFIDYNPTARFWVHDELIGSPEVKLIISDHRHNPFLDTSEHERIENIKDPELHKVYARGLTGKIEGLIYKNWHIVDKMPTEYKSRWIGIDFGFTNDPTAIVDVRLSDGQLWIDEIEYTRGLTNPDISKILEDNKISRRIEIIADSAEPKSIREIHNMGWHIEGAEKGSDSIKAGINILQRYKLNVTRYSKNIITELGAYKWKCDRISGYPLNIPIDEFNHALDAIRYVGLNKLGERRIIKAPRVKTTSIM